MSEPQSHRVMSRPEPELSTQGAPVPAMVHALDAGARRVRTAGLAGAARGHVLAQIAKARKVPLVCVTAGEEEADHLAADLAFFLGGQGTLLSPTVLRLPADEVTP